MENTLFENFCPKCNYNMYITNLTIEESIKKITENQFINAILNNVDDINNFNILFEKKSLENTQTFIKLKEEQKKNILKIFDKLVDKKNETILSYVCRSCNFSKSLNNPTTLLTNNLNIINSIEIEPELKCNDVTLPRTKDYICKNEKCDSNKKNGIKEAVFYRLNDSYQLVYICCICKTYWLN